LEAPDIDGVVMVSSTGTPHPVNATAGDRPARRYPPRAGVWASCAGGVNGLATAARMAAAEPGKRWLFVTIETA
jgi:alkylresorcinol/alkylpyrone synthase